MATEKQWISFAAVKAAVSMEMILDHYGIQLRRVNQTSLRGKCPLPTHQAESKGESFGVNLDKNVWACQSSSCVEARGGRKGGNCLDFVSVVESCSIRDAALKLAEWFHVEAARERPKDSAPAKDQLVAERGEQGRAESDKQGQAPVAEADVNKPLGFELKGIDPTHPYLKHRGLSQETAEAFGVGYFSGKGSMSGRVVIPIHNEKGELVGYAGRAIDDTEPKYKLPAGFKKSLVLYNLNRALKSEGSAVVVVEGFIDAMKVHQAGYAGVVALMGSSLSDEQAELLTRYFDRVALMLDGDDAGRQGSVEIGARLADAQLDVCAVMLASGEQPDRLSSEEIRKILYFLL